MGISWRLSNEALIRRGEVILDFDDIDSWNEGLRRMNYCSVA